MGAVDRVKWDLIHPTVRPVFLKLTEDLAEGYRLGMSKTLFRPFEGYRPPERQQTLFDAGVTKARPWQSAHQYGLAVDYVAWVEGEGWSWADTHDWNFLRTCARGRKLDNEIPWDRPHVEHPVFETVKRALVPQISGVRA